MFNVPKMKYKPLSKSGLKLSRQFHTCSGHAARSARLLLTAPKATVQNERSFSAQRQAAADRELLTCDRRAYKRKLEGKRTVVCRSQMLEKKANKQTQRQQQSSEQEGRFSASTKDLTAFGERWQSAEEDAPSAADVATALATSSETGLADSSEQLEERRKIFGSNQLPGRKEVCRFSASLRLQVL